MTESPRSSIAIGGDTVACAVGTRVTIRRAPEQREVASFDVHVPPVNWLEVATDGRAVTAQYGHRPYVVLMWRDGAGVSELVRSEARDKHPFGYGLARVGDRMAALVAQRGRLVARELAGGQLFEAKLDRPRNFYPIRLVELPGERLALEGCFGDDPFDAVVTVSIADLVRDPLAVQEALARRGPVYDRAIRLGVGPCRSGAAAVFRDPENEEVPDRTDDEAELGDVENFKGLYARDLDAGSLIARIPYDGQVKSGRRVLGTERVFALEVEHGIDIVSRATGQVCSSRAAAAALDVQAARAALLREDGTIHVVDVDGPDVSEGTNAGRW